MSIKDEMTRSMGSRAALALEALSVAIWKRSVEIMREAEIILSENELTPDRAQALLISLLEQRKIAQNLQSQISEGVKATVRINRDMDKASDEAKAEEVAATHGKNRWVRSKVA
jgi:hypothetical protein